MHLNKSFLWAWSRALLAFVVAGWLLYMHGREAADYLFVIFIKTGPTFSILLGLIFLGGAYAILDRLVFFILHYLITRRMLFNPKKANERNVYSLFLRMAREFRATSAEGVYSEDIIEHARGVALQRAVDRQELDYGKSWLEFLGTVAPIVGFMGTLVGLVDSFQELGLGGRMGDVLQGLALSMTTSLLGAIISVIFLSAAWLLGRSRGSFDARIQQMIASAQESDRIGM